VTYNYEIDRQRTWYEAATHCVKLGGSLASLDTQATDQVDFITAEHVPETCLWIGLVRKFFYWTETQRTYTSPALFSKSCVCFLPERDYVTRSCLCYRKSVCRL